MICSEANCSRHNELSEAGALLRLRSFCILAATVSPGKVHRSCCSCVLEWLPIVRSDPECEWAKSHPVMLTLMKRRRFRNRTGMRSGAGHLCPQEDPVVPEGTTEVRKTPLIKGFTCSLRIEITCFVVPNWVAALQSHSTYFWMYRKISTCKTQHKPNCCPTAEYTAGPKKHLILIWLRTVKNEGISLAHALLKRLQWSWEVLEEQRHRKPGRLVDGRGEDALSATELPRRWRTWNRHCDH